MSTAISIPCEDTSLNLLR